MDADLIDSLLKNRTSEEWMSDLDPGGAWNATPRVRSRGWEYPLEEEMASHSSTLA